MKKKYKVKTPSGVRETEVTLIKTGSGQWLDDETKLADNNYSIFFYTENGMVNKGYDQEERAIAMAKEMAKRFSRVLVYSKEFTGRGSYAIVRKQETEKGCLIHVQYNPQYTRLRWREKNGVRDQV